MHSLKKIANALRGLNALEAKPEIGWVKELTPKEKKLAAERFRENLPTALLNHHDRRIALGKRSLASVHNGVCGACHLQLPSGHRRRKASANDLDVCDNCGVFLEWPVPEVPSPIGKANGKKTRKPKTASHS